VHNFGFFSFLLVFVKPSIILSDVTGRMLQDGTDRFGKYVTPAETLSMLKRKTRYIKYVI
jgi:hypothetical protein